MKRIRKGFTLVEIMIVVVIIAVLAAIAIPNSMKAAETSQKRACAANLRLSELAKEQCSMEKKLSTSYMLTEDDLVPVYIKSLPECPNGGIYAIGSVDIDSTCSAPGHRF